MGKYYTKYQPRVHSNTRCPVAGCGKSLAGGRYSNLATGQRVCKDCVEHGAVSQSMYEKATNGTESDESIEEYREEEW